MAHLAKEGWTVGDSNSSDQTKAKELQAYAKTLALKSSEQLAEMIDAKNKAKSARRDLEYDQLPEADCEYYAKTNSWSIAEFFALFFGKDPKTFPHDRILAMCSLPFPSHFEIHYEKMWELIGRDHHFGDIYSPPQKYIDWAIYNKFEVNPALLKAIQDRNSHIAAIENTKKSLSENAIELMAMQLTDAVPVKPLSRTKARNARLKEEEAKILKENPHLTKKEVADAIFKRFKQEDLSLLESNRGGLMDSATIYRILEPKKKRNKAISPPIIHVGEFPTISHP